MQLLPENQPLKKRSRIHELKECPENSANKVRMAKLVFLSYSFSTQKSGKVGRLAWPSNNLGSSALPEKVRAA
jgi:hypothetical protein